MLKNLLVAGRLTALLLALSPTAFGHGGQFRGPGDTVPPNLGGGGDTAPPGNPGGPGSPSPGRGAPTAGVGRSAASGGGPRSPAIANAGQGRVTTGGVLFRSRARGEGFERWEFWWAHNKEPFLNLRAHLEKSQVRTGSGGFFVGRQKRNRANATQRPDATDVKQRILPKLLPLLAEKHPDLVDSAALAVARMLREQEAVQALPALIQTLGHDEKTARESATLALGVLGSREAVEVLRHLLLDTSEGRRLTRKPAEVEDLVRAFAAAGLGLLGDPSTIEDLQRVALDRRLSSKHDLQAMALLSLGLMRERHEEIVPFLLKCMTHRQLARIVRAQAPIALGRLAARDSLSVGVATAALGEVLDLFCDDKTDHDLKRSLAICLGMLATMDDTQAVDVLMQAVQQESDAQVRHFSMMALAQIGAADLEPDRHSETHAQLEKFFLRELASRRVTHRPFGSLGLAVYARSEQLPSLASRATSKIMEAFAQTNNPSHKGAMAISLGLLGAKEAAELLWEEFQSSNDQILKGYLAVALGMTRRLEDLSTIHSLIQKNGLDFKFRLQLARALGLSGDDQAVSTLVEYLQSADTVNETSTAAQALGLIGDRTAIDPLVAVVEDRSKAPLQRGFACVALGIIAEKVDLPWNVAFSVNSNYRAKVPALSEILDIL